MHNGVVGGFNKIRRSLLGLLSDAAYNTIQSFHSDSAVCFSLFLHHLPDLLQQQPPDILLKAMQVGSSSHWCNSPLPSNYRHGSSIACYTALLPVTDSMCQQLPVTAVALTDLAASLAF